MCLEPSQARERGELRERVVEQPLANCPILPTALITATVGADEARWRAGPRPRRRFLHVALLSSWLEVDAQDARYDAIVASSRDSPELERTLPPALLGWYFPASSLSPTVHTRAGTQPRVPMVLGGCRVARASTITDAVTIDNFEAGEIAASHLAVRDLLLFFAPPSCLLCRIRERVRGADSLPAPRISSTRATSSSLAPTVNAARRSSPSGSIRHPHPTAYPGTHQRHHACLCYLHWLRGALTCRSKSLIGFDDYWLDERSYSVRATAHPSQPVGRYGKNALGPPKGAHRWR